MKALFPIFTLLIVAGAARGQDVVDLSGTRHVDTAYAVEEFDAAMVSANDSLRLNDHDCIGDVACTVRLARAGPLGTFGATGDGFNLILTQAELDVVKAVGPERIKVVDYLSVCGGLVNPSTLGCGALPGSWIVLESGVSANVYTHEFGHNRGLVHRDSCGSNIMSSDSSSTENAVNAAECTALGGSVYAEICGEVFDGSGGPDIVGGPLNIFEGPYWTTCDLWVPPYGGLTVEPGVEVQFEPGARITSDGTTTMNGGTDRIEIYSNSDDTPTLQIDGTLIIQNGGELILE